MTKELSLLKRPLLLSCNNFDLFEYFFGRAFLLELFLPELFLPKHGHKKHDQGKELKTT